MKRFQWILYLILLVGLSSCNPKVSANLTKKYPPIPPGQKIAVIGLNEPMPKEAEVLGQVKVGDSGFSTNCSYLMVLGEAELAARKAGGNAIKIIEHIPPSTFGSACHRIKAKILRIYNVGQYIAIQNKENSQKISNLDYAILNVYRFPGPGSLVEYNLHLGDSTLCRVVNNFKTTFHIKKEGKVTLWARTEDRVEVPIDLEHGKVYYLSCGVEMGAFVGHPTLELMNAQYGKDEFDNFNAKHH